MRKIKKSHLHQENVYVYIYKHFLGVGATKQLQYALKSIDKNEVVKGVKGPSVISMLPSFDPVRGVAVDFMHCVLCTQYDA